MLAAASAATALGAGATASVSERFSLTKAIPDDVFVVAAERHNPERAFLDAYWGEVWEAFEQSGVVDDVMKLVLTMLNDDQKAELDRVKERFTQLCAAVDWEQMEAAELVFAERLPVAQRNGVSVSIGTPDIVVLFRVARSAEPIFSGLTAILEAIVDEINTAANIEMKLERTSQDEVELVIFNVTQLAPDDAPSIPISIGRRGDVLFFTLGAEIRNDVANLLAHKGSKSSMADNPRFRSAFERLPPAEDGIVFFDMNNLRSGLQGILDAVLTAIGSGGGDETLNAHRDDEATRLNREGYAAYERKEYAAALDLTQQAYEADPTDSVVLYNLACLHALLDKQDDALSWLERAVAAGFHAPRKIKHDPDLASLRSEPRFQAALELATSKANQSAGRALEPVRRIADRVLGTMEMLDYSAVVQYTDGYSTYTDALAVLSADAKQNPFYPVISGQQPVKDFAKYLPQETESFSVGSGVALDALYEFIEGSFEQAGEPGQQAWAAWQGIQQQFGFDIHKDLLDWLDTSSVNANFKLDGRDAWIAMLKVKDDAAASEKLELALNFIPAKLSELAAKNPALMMLAIRTEPTANEELAGFHDVALAMMPEPAVCGVRDGWLIFGSSENAVLTCLATAAGEHPNVRENEALMAQALAPDGPVDMISFTDHSKDAEQIAAVLSGLSMAGGFVSMAIPDPDAQKIVLRIMQIVSKLAPVVATIDFFDSTASYTQFDGQAWHTKSVTHYVSPSERGQGSSQ